MAVMAVPAETGRPERRLHRIAPVIRVVLVVWVDAAVLVLTVPTAWWAPAAAVAMAVRAVAALRRMVLTVQATVSQAETVGPAVTRDEAAYRVTAILALMRGRRAMVVMVVRVVPVRMRPRLAVMVVLVAVVARVVTAVPQMMAVHQVMAVVGAMVAAAAMVPTRVARTFRAMG